MSAYAAGYNKNKSYMAQPVNTGCATTAGARVETTQARLLRRLADYSRAYPNAWEQAEMFRNEADADWPAWCYLPMGGWYSIICDQNDVDRLTIESDLADLAPLTAMGAWRYTQGIYRFNATLFDELSKTSDVGTLPADVLLRLPEWCVYVELPEGFDHGLDVLHGFFAYLEHDMNSERKELRFVLDQDGPLFSSVALHLGEWSVQEGVQRVRDEAKKRGGFLAPDFTDEAISGTAELISSLLPFLLYICSDEPEVTGHIPGSRPHYASYTRTKRGLRLFPPDKPRVWRIGEEAGAAIERGRVATSASGGERKGPRPHMRRAHWHGFWSGAIKQRPGEEKQPERRFGYKWLPPIVVGVGDDDGE